MGWGFPQLWGEEAGAGGLGVGPLGEVDVHIPGRHAQLAGGGKVRRRLREAQASHLLPARRLSVADVV